MWEKSHCAVARLLLTVSHFKINGHFLAIRHGGMLFDGPIKQPLPTSPSQAEGTLNLFPMLSSGAFNHQILKCDVSAYITSSIVL